MPPRNTHSLGLGGGGAKAPPPSLPPWDLLGQIPWKSVRLVKVKKFMRMNLSVSAGHDRCWESGRVRQSVRMLYMLGIAP